MSSPKQSYKGNGNHEWDLVASEEVQGDGFIVTQRLRVPGGWLYLTVNSVLRTQSESFVPLPKNLLMQADGAGKGVHLL